MKILIVMNNRDSDFKESLLIENILSFRKTESEIIIMFYDFSKCRIKIRPEKNIYLLYEAYLRGFVEIAGRCAFLCFQRVRI